MNSITTPPAMNNDSPEKACPNCGNTNLIGKYCQDCGQKNGLHRDTFWHMLVHFVSDYFHYDNKFFMTMKTLLFKPGKLTVAYIEGKRSTYINPIQLYIFVSAVFFLFFFKLAHVYVNTSNDKELSVNFTMGNDPNAHGDGNAWMTTNCDSVKQMAVDFDDTHKYCDSVYRVTPVEFNMDYFVNVFVNKHLVDFAAKHHIYDTGEMIQAVLVLFIHSIPKLLFVLMPLLAFILLKTFFGSRKNYYVDHTIFSLHFHTFFFISFMVSILVTYLPFENDWLNFFFAFILPVIYFFLSAHRFYRKNWFYTLTVGTLAGGLYIGCVLIVAIIYVILVMMMS